MLWRKGFHPIWREFNSGLAAVGALDAIDIDLALVIPLSDVAVAKREDLKVVFVTELRSIAPTCCDKHELFADHINDMAHADTSVKNGPTRAQLEAIAAWVSKTLNLPNAEDPPRVALEPQIEIARLRYGRLLAGPARTIAGENRQQTIGGEHSTPLPLYLRQVVVAYDDAMGTIYLLETGAGQSVPELSVLGTSRPSPAKSVAAKYACAGAREKPACIAQAQWLEDHGLDLELEFDTDMFTVVTMSAWSHDRTSTPI